MLRRAYIAAVVAAAVVASGCTGESGSDDRHGIDDTPTPNGGTLTAAYASAVFAAVVAPLPGTTPASEPGVSPTGAIAMVTALWDELSAAQRQRIDEVLRVPAVETVDTAGSGSSGDGGRGGGLLQEQEQESECLAALRPPSPEVAQAGPARRFLRQRLGRGLDRPVVWYAGNSLAGADPPEQRDAATAYPVVCEGGDWKVAATANENWEACLVRRGPAWDSLTRYRAVWAHEQFHCYQMELANLPGRDAHLPPWVREGAASWVGLERDPQDTESRRDYARFFSERRALSQRRYSGVAVFAALDDAGRNVWQTLLPLTEYIIQRGVARSVVSSTDSTVDAVQFLLDAGQGTQFSTNFATSAALQPDLGPSWTITGPGVPAGPGRTFSPLVFGNRRELRVPLDRTGDPVLWELDPIPANIRALKLTVDNPHDHGAIMVGADLHRFAGQATYTFCLDASQRVAHLAITRWPAADDSSGRAGPLPLIEVEDESACIEESTSCIRNGMLLMGGVKFPLPPWKIDWSPLDVPPDYTGPECPGGFFLEKGKFDGTLGMGVHVHRPGRLELDPHFFSCQGFYPAGNAFCEDLNMPHIRGYYGWSGGPGDCSPDPGWIIRARYEVPLPPFPGEPRPLVISGEIRAGGSELGVRCEDTDATTYGQQVKELMNEITHFLQRIADAESCPPPPSGRPWRSAC